MTKWSTKTPAEIKADIDALLGAIPAPKPDQYMQNVDGMTFADRFRELEGIASICGLERKPEESDETLIGRINERLIMLRFKWKPLCGVIENAD